ncbi:MAG: hypothetical protein CMJ25_06775 [Phycisphaerae bacterium]|nr:hypothetical protein [Phycisphaerae bacterium]|tara:strand:+ start:1207 stop:1821 length:615 start_codon:yes stop_codon:yes gene_type:complete
MAAGDTDLSICSDALIMLGASPISSFTEGTDAAQACDRLYPDLRDSLLARYPWSWTYKKTSLGRLATAPINEFRYAYQLPGNILSGVQAVFETSASNQNAINDGWEIYGDQLYTDLETVFIDYQETISESKMPVYFVHLLRNALAGELGIVITDQASKADYFRSIAYGSPGENGRGGLFREAVNIDSRGRLPQIIEDYALIQVR